MNQKIKLSRAISYVIIATAAILFLAIWPLEFIQQKYVSKSNEIIAMESDPVNVEHNVTQMFVGEGGELSAVDLYVCNDMRGETITFRLYDSGYNEIFNTFHVVKENQKYPDFVHIPVGYDIEKDMEYYFTLEGLSADMTVAYEDRETSTSIVNGFMSYGGVEIQRYNVVIRYEYSNPFVWWQVVILGVMLAGVAAGLSFGVKKLFEKKFTDRDVKIHTVFQVVLNPIVIVVGLVWLYMIFPGRKFGRDMLDHVFLFGGVGLLLLELLWLINFKRMENKPIVDINALKVRIPEYLQSICIAATIWYCCEYMNGLYEIHHSLSARKMLIWFFLGLLCTYSKKELLRVWNIGYVLVAGIASYLYAKPYLGMEEAVDLRKLDAWLFVIAGFVIWLLIISIIRIIKGKCRVSNKLQIPYAVFFMVLMGGMIIFRNGRNWIIALTVIFAIFYLRMWMWDKTSRMVLIVSNGLVLNFIYMVVYSLMHRPYQRFIFSRYALGFHTVTVTGVYLSLMLSVIVVKFLIKFYKSSRIRDMWPELILLCVANAYLIMTFSRTGYLSAMATEVFAVILFACKKAERKLLCVAKQFCIIGLVSVIALPTVFTMTKIIPAVVDEPELSEIEMTGYHVRKGMPANAQEYIKVERFFELIGIKLMGNSDDARLERVLRGVHVVDDTMLVASIEDDIEINSSINNISNGRIDIFKEYIANWNLYGHEEMSLTKEDGVILPHAHNVFLQVTHDHGVPTGVLFVLFGVVSFVLAMIRFFKGNNIAYAFLASIIVAFAVSGLVEWNFHLCQPFGIALFMVLTPLLFKNKDILQDEQ